MIFHVLSAAKKRASLPTIPSPNEHLSPNSIIFSFHTIYLMRKSHVFTLSLLFSCFVCSIHSITMAYSFVFLPSSYSFYINSHTITLRIFIHCKINEIPFQVTAQLKIQFVCKIQIINKLVKPVRLKIKRIKLLKTLDSSNENMSNINTFLFDCLL